MSAKVAPPVPLAAAIGVWAVSFVQFGSAAVSPAIMAISFAFPDQPVWLVTMVSTLPSLTTLLGCLLFSVVVGRKVSFKITAVVSLLIFGVFGVLPTFFNDNLWVILIARALTGLGIGFIMPLPATWFLRMIRNRDQRGFYLSWNLAIGSIGSVIMTILGGFLCAIDWKYTFLAFALVFLSLIIVLACFKDPKSVEEILKEDGTTNPAEFEAAKRAHLGPAAWFIIVVYFFFQIAACTAMNLGAIVMDAHIGIGVALIGTLMALFTVGTAVSSTFGGWYLRVFGKFTTPIFLVIAAVGCLLVANGDSVFMFALGYFVIGVGATMNGLVNFEIGLVTKVSAVAWAASLLMFATNLGNFCSSFFIGFAQSIGGPTAGIEFPVVLSAGILIVLAIAFAIMNCCNKAAWGKDAIAQREAGSKFDEVESIEEEQAADPEALQQPDAKDAK